MKKLSRPFYYALAALLLAALIAVRQMTVTQKNVPVPAALVQEHKLLLQYDVYASGFKALSASLTIGMDKKAYDMAMEAETRGLIGRLFPWKVSMDTTGRIGAKGALIPILHTDRTTWRQKVSLEEMSYDPHGKVVKMTTQDDGKAAADLPIDNALSNHAVDVLTGTLALLQNADSTHHCTGQFPVFDGKRRFNITLTDDGTEILASSRYSRFEGEAMRCILKVEPAAGFEPKDEKRGWMAVQNYTEARHKLPTLWLARIKDSEQVIPVRMEIASAYGSVVANLSR
jgi:hypothetical protein